MEPSASKLHFTCTTSPIVEFPSRCFLGLEAVLESQLHLRLSTATSQTSSVLSTCAKHSERDDKTFQSAVRDHNSQSLSRPSSTLMLNDDFYGTFCIWFCWRAFHQFLQSTQKQTQLKGFSLFLSSTRAETRSRGLVRARTQWFIAAHSIRVRGIISAQNNFAHQLIFTSRTRPNQICICWLH